jgi:hypothetical protein
MIDAHAGPPSLSAFARGAERPVSALRIYAKIHLLPSSIDVVLRESALPFHAFVMGRQINKSSDTCQAECSYVFDWLLANQCVKISPSAFPKKTRGSVDR